MTLNPELRRELEIAMRVKPLLDRSADRLPTATTERLRAARERALMVQKREVQGSAALAGTGMRVGIDWMWRIVPIVVLVVGLIGIKQWHEAQLADEIADIDTKVLVDELPPNAYLDKGFGAWLARPAQ